MTDNTAATAIWPGAMVLALVLGLPTMLLSGDVKAQSVQRLFSSPTLREQLDRIRQRGDLTANDEEILSVDVPVFEDIFREEAPPPDIIYTLAGAVKQRDGQYTVWINGQPIHQDDLPDNMELLSPFDQGKLRISNPLTGEVFQVKPGQVLNLSTGTVLESYQVRPEVLVDLVPMTDVEDVAAGAATSQGTDNVIIDEKEINPPQVE